MNVSLFISRRLKFKGGIVMTCIAVSYFVMIIAVAVSSGFRTEIRRGISELSGDIQLTPPDLNVLDSSHPLEWNAPYLPYIRNVDGVQDVVPVIYRAGIVRQDGNIHGVLFKGIETAQDSIPLAISIPERLSQISGLKEGDRMTVYFIGEKVSVRQFNISLVYDSIVETDDRLVVYADIDDLRRLDGWTENQVSSIEVILDKKHKSERDISELTQEIGAFVNAYSYDSESPVVAVSSVSKYPQLFDWLDLIDFNVLFIIILMTIVAGFNMISGLLIMLFENTSTIGLLKSMGMTDRGISNIFLSSAAVLVLKGMFVGNALAFLFCLIQDRLHILRLDPENYFVSFVPVDLSVLGVVCADIISFVIIMLLLLIPALFISRVDPAQTVRVK